MKNFVLAVLAFAVLAGCATEAQKTASTFNDPGPDEATIALNVRGGQFMQFETSYSGGGTIEFTMRSANADPHWAPMAGLCVKAASGGDDVCLKFALINRDSNEIAAVMEVLSADRKTLLSRQRLDGLFHVGETIKVGVRADGNKLQFAVNGAQPVSHTLAGPPSFIDLLCSTATCGMRVL